MVSKGEKTAQREQIDQIRDLTVFIQLAIAVLIVGWLLWKY